MKKNLSLPVPKDIYTITEGWIYSNQESSIHGTKEHLGIDYSCPRGTKIFAAASGWAVASYRCRKLIDKTTGKPKTYKGKEITNSRGNFIQIFHPETQLITSYFHLVKIANSIPLTPPFRKGEELDTEVLSISPNEYDKYKHAVWIKQGAIIGFVGDSGLTWGYNDYPKRPDSKKFPSWDETHLHFRVHTQSETGEENVLDPYAIWKNFKSYPWPSHIKSIGKNHLWQKIEEGLPI